MRAFVGQLLAHGAAPAHASAGTLEREHDELERRLGGAHGGMRGAGAHRTRRGRLRAGHRGREKDEIAPDDWRALAAARHLDLPADVLPLAPLERRPCVGRFAGAERSAPLRPEPRCRRGLRRRASLRHRMNQGHRGQHHHRNGSRADRVSHADSLRSPLRARFFWARSRPEDLSRARPLAAPLARCATRGRGRRGDRCAQRDGRAGSRRERRATRPRRARTRPR